MLRKDGLARTLPRFTKSAAVQMRCTVQSSTGCDTTASRRYPRILRRLPGPDELIPQGRGMKQLNLDRCQLNLNGTRPLAPNKLHEISNLQLHAFSTRVNRSTRFPMSSAHD